MPNKYHKHLFILSFLTLFSSPAWAEWQLNNDDSRLYYVTSKAAAISEVNTFHSLSGSIDEAGNAKLQIDLSSVDTNIDLRDQRVRDMLFEVGSYPSAEVSLSLDAHALDGMSTGSTHVATYDYTLSLHGTSSNLSSELKVTKLSNGSLEIQSLQPIIVNAGSFALTQGVEALREVAGLPSINPNVVVSFSLVYDETM